MPVTETPESARDSLVLPMMLVRGVLGGGESRWVCGVVVVASWLSDSVAGGGGEGFFLEESGWGLDGWSGWLASATFIEGLRLSDERLS